MKKLVNFLINAVLLLPRQLAMGLIRGYQLLIAPVIPGGCRFYPSCSNYALDAFSHHGAIKGAWLTVNRLARCQPWGGQGFDPVVGSSLDLERHSHNHSQNRKQGGHSSCHHVQ